MARPGGSREEVQRVNTDPDLESRKSALRRKVRDALARLTPAKRSAASERVRKAIHKLAESKQAQSILFFAPLGDEVDVWPLLSEAISGRWTIALPRYDSAEQAYIACQVRDLQQDIEIGRFGVREPNSSCEPIPLNRLDLVLVPGVAFDRHGSRLGRGKGYYDRLLADVRGTKCGIAFDEQIVQEVPAGPHDIRVNCILTPTRRIET